MGKAADQMGQNAKRAVEEIESQIISRTTRASLVLRNNAKSVLRGQRHGRRYRVPYTKRFYTASAPGEPPAVRTGAFRSSWRMQPRTERVNGNLLTHARIVSGLKVNGHRLGDLLENGTTRMAPRPYKKDIIDKSTGQVQRIFKAPYLR
ncbi:hypothetical protein CLOSTMETH_01737 [[Clostridium] methylpentosum DSM 5476]|uniref:Phage protein, HK97 gp10 family n=1 Tax=[Clostridium] methylpentosum DSM 5476 TaxID=537013 RepID=C0ED16_9FIRM|nr:hypothetical protein CLOSTMETH_01737 [[Clostridium] methylpentosum DSM 5476]